MNRDSVICKLARMKWYLMRMYASSLCPSKVLRSEWKGYAEALSMLYIGRI